MDKTDRRILEILQSDATMSAVEIAEKVGLSQSPCWRRINRLEKKGIIVSSKALVNGRTRKYYAIEKKQAAVVEEKIKALYDFNLLIQSLIKPSL